MEDVDRGMRILVVDDEQLVRWFLERALKKWGHDVVTASNVDEALGMINGRGFDLLFTDLRMPERGGADLLERLSEIKGKQPKVIVCSAFITADMASDFRSRGYLTLKKPFKLSELQDTMRQCEDVDSPAEG
ncbi:MAG: response regulator [Nitrospirota bacterium]|jgi:DNA-binding NtrC family response regulator